MSDDFDSLFDTASTAAAAGIANTGLLPTQPLVLTPSVTAPEINAAPALYIALYKSGAGVQYGGERHTVNYVHISRNGLFIRLKDKEGVVPAEMVDIPLTRMVLPMGAYQAPNLLLAPLPPGPARTK